jgi:hypothetical protein
LPECILHRIRAHLLSRNQYGALLGTFGCSVGISCENKQNQTMMNYGLHGPLDVVHVILFNHLYSVLTFIHYLETYEPS